MPETATPAPATTATHAETASRVRAGRRARSRSRLLVTVALAVLTAALLGLAVMGGHTYYSPAEVWGVIRGETVPGASFAVGELRLPRACLGLLTGAGLGMAGVTFQTMLRNALASPDVIGISAGAGAAAVFGLLVLRLGQTQISLLAVAAALLTAMTSYLLSLKGGMAGTRLILIGIGISSMLSSVTSYLLSKAAAWDVGPAMRWLTGSLNDAEWDQVAPLSIAFVVLVPLLLSQSHALRLTQLGDDAAAALGVRVERTRVLAILAAVGLVACATAAAGPISFVAFLAGPLAARIVKPGGSLMVPAALVGAALVLASDFAGQYAFGTRYPVGVITGVLGAPYLVYLLIRTNRTGGSL